MEEKEKLVEDLRKEVEMLSEKLKKRGLFKSSSKTMTGLPKDKIQQSDNFLKFKPHNSK